jgi:hypothetical protein
MGVEVSKAALYVSITRSAVKLGRVARMPSVLPHNRCSLQVTPSIDCLTHYLFIFGFIYTVFFIKMHMLLLR